MAGWAFHKGLAVALPRDNVDTDQLIPARFMSVPRSAGYGDYLLHDLRRDEDGALHPDFPLNRHPAASILVAGRNFGSGSSREAAVYALVDAGFRAVIAPSFGDIFAGNAVNNGLLPARVSPEDAAALTQALHGATAEATVDLETGEIMLGDLHVDFSLDDSWRTKLINGWDDIDLTRQHSDAIARFREGRRQVAPWAWPAAEA
ncbi:3-isopropylmalate dehydratase small subunit [Marimonas arenosa]|uniref:3-isopropylmalate dehydratase n=1 Tax=Marimonas arenosa TaxID=1795305 RepID=A0AAE3WFX3_9RHOB|nr:3-isopropylmalate dehydratase small subunit [Marimonas arenosa]MDQ2091808.1 3-isopropylmalate dehydratase small subunit [Marimonas arenosa]